MRCFFSLGADSASAGNVTVTAAPSGNADASSSTTTPLCTRPEIFMELLFAVRQLESSGTVCPEWSQQSAHVSTAWEYTVPDPQLSGPKAAATRAEAISGASRSWMRSTA